MGMGLFIPFSINPMSVYSMSLKLIVDAGLTHPVFQMDDLTQYMSATAAAKRRVPLVMIPLPLINGPTSGINLYDEFQEWWRQGVRWTIGAAEVFHYICIKGFT